MENLEQDRKLELLGGMLSLYGRDTRPSAITTLYSCVENYSADCLEKAIVMMLQTEKFFSVAGLVERLEYASLEESEIQRRNKPPSQVKLTPEQRRDLFDIDHLPD
jgi:hypothetical protein